MSQVLAAEIVVGVLVPEEVDQAPDRVAPLHPAGRMVLHDGVGQEAVEVCGLVADIERPGVAGDQLLDFDPILERDLRLHFCVPFVSALLQTS